MPPELEQNTNPSLLPPAPMGGRRGDHRSALAMQAALPPDPVKEADNLVGHVGGVLSQAMGSLSSKMAPQYAGLPTAPRFLG